MCISRYETIAWERCQAIRANNCHRKVVIAFIHKGIQTEFLLMKGIGYSQYIHTFEKMPYART